MKLPNLDPFTVAIACLKSLNQFVSGSIDTPSFAPGFKGLINDPGVHALEVWRSSPAEVLPRPVLSKHHTITI